MREKSFFRLFKQIWLKNQILTHKSCSEGRENDLAAFFGKCGTADIAWGQTLGTWAPKNISRPFKAKLLREKFNFWAKFCLKLRKNGFAAFSWGCSVEYCCRGITLGLKIKRPTIVDRCKIDFLWFPAKCSAQSCWKSQKNGFASNFGVRVLNFKA